MKAIHFILSLILMFASGGNALVKADAYRAAISSAMTEKLWSVFDIYKPQEYNKLFRTKAQQGKEWMLWLRSMMREEPLGDEMGYFHEDTYIVDTIVVQDTVASPGVGNPISITIDASRIDPNTNKFYARENFIVTIPGTEDQVQIKNVDRTNYTLDLYPVLATATIPELTAGMELGITNGAWAAGTDGPDKAQRGYKKYEYYTQTFKEAIGAEGSQLAKDQWFDAYSDDGQTLIGWYTPATIDMEYRMMLQEGGAYLFGQPNTNNLKQTTPDGESNITYMTEGVVPQIRKRGFVMPDPMASMVVEDYFDISNYLISQSLTYSTVSGMAGKAQRDNIDQLLIDYIGDKSGGTDFTRTLNGMFGKNGESATEMGAYFGFGLLQLGGTQIALQTLYDLSNPKTFGAKDYNFNEYMLVLPIGRIKDSKSGKEFDNFSSMYRAHAGTNRKYRVWKFGGAGNTDVSIDSIDRVNCGALANHGLRFMGANQTIGIFPEAA